MQLHSRSLSRKPAGIPDEALDAIVDLENYPIGDGHFRTRCRDVLDNHGSLVLNDFLKPAAIESVRSEGLKKQRLAYYCVQTHNVYLKDTDPRFDHDHSRNRVVKSSKGCITDDQISKSSPLRVLYDSRRFRQFLCAVLDEEAMHAYADPLSSINIHYAKHGQELGWHFDNSSFVITLMIQAPESGGTFEYVRGLRNSEQGDMNFEGVEQVLNGKTPPSVLEMEAGTLVLFRGRDAIHRVTPVTGARTRVLVVLAYNSRPGVSLSESARMTFYGRLE